MIETQAAPIKQTHPEFDFESLFPFVSKPSRYIGGEWNSVQRDKTFREKAVGICLAFPDLYETGFANMGMSILYQVVNQRQDAFAERVYAPDQDLAMILEKRGWPFFSLESKTPLSQFDILGFSLPYELCYTNVLEMLHLAQIPFHSSQRDHRYPLIVGGGPCAVNPEPLADFFDAIVIGDGEDILQEIVERVKWFKSQEKTCAKSDLLRSLASIPGLYVPSLYEVSYHSDQTIEKIVPKIVGIPEKVSYRQTRLAESVFPLAPVVPFVQTVHDRLNVEIQRGCPWRCRFCQAGFSYHTYRERSADQILNLVNQGLSNTGYDAVTLAGLSAADHREIIPLLQVLSKELTSRRISVGLPSTRADRFTLALAELLHTVRRQSLTFAPEAGTERLRRVIRKELEEIEIRETLRFARLHGWKNVKLYFMYGLPTEQHADLAGVVDLVRHSKKENVGLALTCTLSPFVPKPHTPFQWHPQDRPEVLREKLGFLRKNLSAQVRAHGLEQIELEGVLSRGDRRCSRLLERAWELGAKFDEWGERFRPEIWQRAFQETGLSPDFFCYRSREESEILPWDTIEGGPEKRALWNDYQTSLRQAVAPAEVPHLKERPPVPAFDPATALKKDFFQERSVQKLRFRLGREGAVRFLSHLEQIEMVRRTLRRSEFPLCFTQGFHPQMRCSFGPAISVGYESDCEYFDLELSRRVVTEEARARFSSKLAEGFSLREVHSVPLTFPSLESLISRVDYSVFVPHRLLRGKRLEDWNILLEEFLNRKDLIVEQVKKSRGTRPNTLPLTSLILKASWEEGTEDGVPFALSLRFGPGKNVKPERILAFFLGLEESETPSLVVRRRGFYVERPDGSWMEP